MRVSQGKNTCYTSIVMVSMINCDLINRYSEVCIELNNPAEYRCWFCSVEHTEKFLILCTKN